MRSEQDPGLEFLLRRADALIGRAAEASFALGELGGIVLPPASADAADRAQLQAIAALYLAAEMEAAGVIPAAESLVQLAHAGSLPVDLGEAAALVQSFWRARNERFSEGERLGYFAGLFGTPGGPESSERPPNRHFEDRLIDLCEALYRLDEGERDPAARRGVGPQARVRSAALQLLANLQHASGGLTLFVAQEVLTALRDALAILRHPAIRAAHGARTVWDVVDAVDRRVRRRRRQHGLHMRRGQAGMTVLAWLAEVAPSLERSQPVLGPDHPVIGAAVEWMECSLALSEAEDASVPTRGISLRAAQAG